MFKDLRIFFDGDDGGGNGGGGSDPPKPKLKDLIQQHNLQDELNSMMAQNKRQLKEQNDSLVQQLEQLKTNTRLTQDERDELQNRITQLEEQYMTKEELAKRESAKAEKKWKEDIDKVTKSEERWRSMYTSETIERSLQDAAIAGEAHRAEQIVEILRNRTQLAEVIKDGQPTGQYTPVVKFNDTDDNGGPVVLELTPSEAIKRMKELPERFGNLFRGTATGGLGETGNATGGSKALKDVLKDPEAYAKWRKENPDLDITKLRR